MYQSNEVCPDMPQLHNTDQPVLPPGGVPSDRKDSTMILKKDWDKEYDSHMVAMFRLG